jgi:hypothetical protein
MAGILDTKTRVMDVVVTDEGKRQIGSGGFKIAYATFTDKNAFYDKSSISGSFDSASQRAYIEASSLAYDVITIEKDDNGAVIPFATVTQADGTRVNATAGVVISDSKPVQNLGKDTNQSLIDTLLSSTIDNFKKQMIISSRDPLDESETFELSTNEVSFNYGNRGPIVGSDIISSIDQAASVFTDKHFSNALNFMFMPPVAKSNAGEAVLGQYKDVREAESYTYDDLIGELIGKVPDQPICPYAEVQFFETSATNDICIQAFESGQYLRKLDMVDFGSYFRPGDPNPNKRVIFLGKNYTDSYGATNFANIFTIILE